MPSKAEIVFAEYWSKYQNVFPLEAEKTFHKSRRWRIDFSNSQYKLAIELQGHGWGHGGNAKSLASDIEKHQALALLGWTYFPILSSAVTKRVDIAVKPVIEWINTYTDVKIQEGW